MAEWEELRIAVFVRDLATREFMIFEEEAQRFIPDDYEWRFNRCHTLDGYEKATGEHRFGGSRPARSSRSTAPCPALPAAQDRPDVQIVDPAAILAYIKYREDWISIDG